MSQQNEVLNMSAMTVRDLRKLLADPDIKDTYVVVLAKDAEGNDFSPVPKDENYTLAKYIPDTTYSGEIRSGEDLEPSDKINALVLWPTN
jgi:hypothetical protein